VLDTWPFAVLWILVLRWADSSVQYCSHNSPEFNSDEEAKGERLHDWEVVRDTW